MALLLQLLFEPDPVQVKVPALFTVIEYDLVVVPSWAVTMRLITVGTVLKEMLCEAEPEATVVPLTVIAAPALLAVGVTVSAEVDAGTVVV